MGIDYSERPEYIRIPRIVIMWFTVAHKGKAGNNHVITDGVDVIGQSLISVSLLIQNVSERKRFDFYRGPVRLERRIDALRKAGLK